MHSVSSSAAIPSFRGPGFVVTLRFFKYRHMKKDDLGPGIEDRHKLREKLQCKSFEWFLGFSVDFFRMVAPSMELWNFGSFRKKMSFEGHQTI